MKQKELVEAIYAYYKEFDIIPGDPEDGRWEEAHYPAPKWAGGTETVLLLHDHHQWQGLIQSKEFGKASFFMGHVKEFLNKNWCDDWFEMWDLYDAVPTGVTGKRMFLSPDGERRFFKRGDEPEGWVPCGTTSGRVMSDETKELIALTKRGKPMSDKTRAKMRASHTGVSKTFSDQAKENMKEGQQNSLWISFLTGMVTTGSRVVHHNKQHGGTRADAAKVPEALRSIVQKGSDRTNFAYNLEAYDCWLSLCGEVK